MTNQVYELHVEREYGHVTATTLYGIHEGQLRLITSELWGPFCTALEVSQWVWRNLTLDLNAPAVVHR